MSEREKVINEQQKFVEEFLIKEKGIDPVEANEVADFVLEATKAFRLKKFEKWVNTIVEVHIEDMRIECLIMDLRVTAFGIVQYQIKPLAGKGHRWVDSTFVKSRH